MNYLSEMLKLPVVDSTGERIGIVNDLGIATGEVFPHVTSLAFQGPGKTPFMISWRKYVERFDDDGNALPGPYAFYAGLVPLQWQKLHRRDIPFSLR